MAAPPAGQTPPSRHTLSPAPLAAFTSIGFASRPMPSPSPLRRALAAGAVAAAATAGLAVGIGRRADDPLAAFRLGGRTLLAMRGISAESIPAYAAFLGLLHHVAVGVVWGALVAAVALPLRPMRRLLVVAAAGGGLWFLSRTVLPPAARLDLGVPDGTPRVLLFVCFAIALLGASLLGGASARR
jgi:hypothetical protein